MLTRLRDAGHVAYFAGGCVRDLLLGKEPKDFDVATDAPPTRVRELFRNTQAVGAAFGVILVRVGKSVVEVATFRSDGDYLDGRRPSEVRFTNAAEDAKRRDFTINGLFLDPLKPGTLEEQIIDYVGGRDDLHRHQLRAIGEPDARFAEDYLRLLRAIRFAARLGFEIEPTTAAAIAKHAPKLKQISPERVGEELRLMLTPVTRATAYGWLDRFGLLDVILRALPDGEHTSSTDRPSVFPLLEPGKPISFGLALAGLFVSHHLRRARQDWDLLRVFEKRAAQSAAKAFRQTLKISNDESDELLGILTGVTPLLGGTPLSLAIRKRFLAKPTANASIALLAALSDFGEWRPRLDPILAQLSELAGVDPAPTPLITGDDLTAAGLRPGPKFKSILDRTYDEQLEGRLASKDEAMAFAMKLEA